MKLKILTILGLLFNPLIAMNIGQLKKEERPMFIVTFK